MHSLLLFVFLLINFQVEAKNSCNDECLTKTYCISSDGSGVCSKNNMVTAQFRVIPVFGKYDNLELTLKGYNVAPDEEKTIKVSIEPSSSPENIYTCYKSSLGTTNARFDRDTYSSITGTSYYYDGVLYCVWVFNIYDSISPQDVDLIQDISQTIALYDESQKVMVAQNTSQLPIYHVQYLKCCNIVHGNDAFILTFDRTKKEIRYRLYYWKNDSTQAVVFLTRRDGIKLQFKCYIDSKIVGYISNGAERISIDKQLIEPAVINKEICSWATPFVLGSSNISIDASTSVFDLRVEADLAIVYTEKDVILESSSRLFNLSFPLIGFAVLFQISFIYF